MSTPAAPQRRSPSAAQLFGLLVILVLVLVGLAQCGSDTEKSSTPEPVETSETASPASERPAVDEPVTLPSAPVFEPAPNPVPVPIPEPAPTPEPAPVPDYSDNDSSSGSVYYKNCSAARAAGAAPLHAGEPGYSSHLDRDGDGIACE